jgi:hypothetical protein
VGELGYNTAGTVHAQGWRRLGLEGRRERWPARERVFSFDLLLDLIKTYPLFKERGLLDL